MAFLHKSLLAYKEPLRGKAAPSVSLLPTSYGSGAGRVDRDSKWEVPKGRDYRVLLCIPNKEPETEIILKLTEWIKHEMVLIETKWSFAPISEETGLLWTEGELGL